MYNAIVAPIEKMDNIEGADRIAAATVLGFTVVVPKDTPVGEVGVYFPTDGQISLEFAEANNLLRRVNPETGKNEGGFFHENRRVMAQRFKKVKSEGFWCPLDYFEFTGNTDELQVGYRFSRLNDIPICNKYITQATRAAMAKNPKLSVLNVLLPRHYDTEQLRFAPHHLTGNALYIFTEKEHGTSGATGNVPEEITLTRFQRLWNSIPFLPKYEKVRYGYFSRTRNTILQYRPDIKEGTSDFYRHRVHDTFVGKLHRGEVVYYEIVGYDENGTPIMHPHETKKAGDKDIVKRYGNTMIYCYGCSPDGIKYKVRLYRITFVDESGAEIEMSWNYVVKRARELGLETVHEITRYYYGDAFPNEKVGEAVFNIANSLVEGQSFSDDTHIMEGVVIRKEGNDGEIRAFKHKSFTFGMLEGYLKAENVVDVEESS